MSGIERKVPKIAEFSGMQLSVDKLQGEIGSLQPDKIVS